MRGFPLVAVMLVGACASKGASTNGPPPAARDEKAIAWDASWDALCPTEGASATQPIHVNESVQFEPSGAAVWKGRIALVGDKQTHLWWWKPGSPTVERDPAWDVKTLDAPDGKSCCTSRPDGWGSPVKQKKAQETCLDHGVSTGSGVPWLKAEGLTSSPVGIFMTGNMGFGCRDNGFVMQVRDDGSAPVPLAGSSRDDVMKAIGASDIRVEGVAAADDANTILIAVRQKDDAFARTIVVLNTRDRTRTTADVHVPEGGALPVGELGMSDLTVLRDGRVAILVSRELDVDGKRVVGGQLLVTLEREPWKRSGRWTTTRVLEITDHKPEAVVQLSTTCLALVHDDDEKYKAQHRDSGSETWASNAAFVTYVRVP